MTSQANTTVEQVLKIIDSEQENFRKKYDSYIMRYKMDSNKEREFKNYFEIELGTVISKFLSSSTQTFCKKIIRAYSIEIDQKISETYRNFRKETWESFCSYCNEVLIKFSDEIENLQSSYKDLKSIFTDEVMEEFKQNRPAPTIPRVAGGPMKEWLNAIAKEGPMPGSNFEYSVPLSELVLLGVLAMRTGKRLDWDGKTGRITNDKSLNRYVDITARAGWRV